MSPGFGTVVAVGFIIVIIICAIVLHELTHFAVARSVGATDIELERVSLFLVGFRIHFPDETPTYKLRLVGLAPFLVGALVALVFLAVGGHEWLLQRRDPFHFAVAVGSWTAYSHVSHADLLLGLGYQKSEGIPSLDSINAR